MIIKTQLDLPSTDNAPGLGACTKFRRRLAYATAGKGPPLVKVATWLSHLEFDWEFIAYHDGFRSSSAWRCRATTWSRLARASS